MVSIVFCNGPQCPQTPDAIGHLLEAGHPAASIAYYRGGLHDWVTLGYPIEAGLAMCTTGPLPPVRQDDLAGMRQPRRRGDGWRPGGTSVLLRAPGATSLLAATPRR